MKPTVTPKLEMPLGAADDPVDFIHTGPGTPAGTVLRQFWQPVYVARKLLPGHSKPLTIMNQKLALYRSQNGAVHCVENRCGHRGALLSTGWVEGDIIRCPYHGWAFDPNGQCVHQPMEGAGYARNVRIAGYPAREYLGLIYVYLGDGEPPEFPRYPEWENAKFVAAQIDTRQCNWFQNLENFVDEGHVWFTHLKSAFEDLSLDVLPKISNESTPWGLRCIASTPDGRKRKSLYGWPNVGMFAVHPNNIRRPGEPANTREHAWQMFLDYRVPINDESHMQVHAIAVFLDGEIDDEYKRIWQDFDASEAQAHDVARRVMAGELHYDEIPSLCHHTPLAQDGVVQVGQGVYADRRKGIENLGATDVSIVAMRRLWTEQLNALSEGRALREFHRPEGLLPLPGTDGDAIEDRMRS